MYGVGYWDMVFDKLGAVILILLVPALAVSSLVGIVSVWMCLFPDAVPLVTRERLQKLWLRVILPALTILILLYILVPTL